MKTVFALTLCVATTLAISLALAAENEQPVANQSNAPSQAAIKQARRTVAMLDNIYKQVIVLITDKYVHDVDDFAAGSAAVLLFKNITDSGSHAVRLIDATGEPYNPDNVAQDDFEREALKQIKAGKQTYDQIETKDGKQFLRAMTPVPVVMQRCIMCHDHYADVKEGEAIGAISYTIPLE